MNCCFRYLVITVKMAELSSDNKSNNINDTSNTINDDKSENINNNKSDNVRDRDTREIIRRQFYKNRISKNNIKLEMDNTPQEERRRLLLEYQKQHRDETINIARGIFQEYSKLENEECMEAEYTNIEKYMGSEDYTKVEASWHYRILPGKTRANHQMMLSEWMLDIPQDFTENWVMVPCPVGNRTRLISSWGETRAYSRRGKLHCVFPSALPGGNPDSDLRHSAAVDCIWVKNQKLYYILDVLYWSSLPFTNCEAEFRLFWIKNKFQEISELKERDLDTNKYPILTLQNIDCNSDFSSALANLDEQQPLDGFLFYHRKALYTYGCTPLVTWLKPFMLSEVLGISVPSLFDEKPINYINFEHHIQKVKTKKNRDAPKIVTNSMEVESV